MTTRAAIVAEAREWIGTPWQHQQRTKGQAVDCAGLIIGVGKNLGLLPEGFDINGYGRHPDGTLMSVCKEHMHEIAKTDMQPGDVLVVSIENDPQHMGFIADYRHGGLSFIHAASKTGKVIETRLMFARNLKFRGAYALRGVD